MPVTPLRNGQRSPIQGWQTPSRPPKFTTPCAPKKEPYRDENTEPNSSLIHVCPRRLFDIPMRGPAASSEDAPIAGFWGPQKPFSEETKMEAETQEESQAMKQGNACTVDDLSFKMHELLFSRAGQGDGLKSVAWEEPKMW